VRDFLKEGKKMACNNYKNRNYKSALQFFNSTDQDILATNTVTNPVSVELGDEVTDTGIAFDLLTRSIRVNANGLYRFSAIVNIVGGTAGLVTVAMTLDGNTLPETAKTVDIGGATTEVAVPLETVRRLSTCCALSEHNIGIVAYSDGTAVGAIDSVSGNAVKLA
jgi:hypothetical protein